MILLISISHSMNILVEIRFFFSYFLGCKTSFSVSDRGIYLYTFVVEVTQPPGHQKERHFLIQGIYFYVFVDHLVVYSYLLGPRSTDLG